MMIMENSHKIKFLRESLHVNVGEVKRIVKHCEMMNNNARMIAMMIDDIFGVAGVGFLIFLTRLRFNYISVRCTYIVANHV